MLSATVAAAVETRLLAFSVSMGSQPIAATPAVAARNPRRETMPEWIADACSVVLTDSFLATIGFLKKQRYFR
jgi:hypothetical protein